jgi:hypothetical protein
MAVITIEDVLKHAERFEQMLADFYADLSKHSCREGVRLLTDYMSRHRERIVDALEKLSPKQAKSVRLRFDTNLRPPIVDASIESNCPTTPRKRRCWMQPCSSMSVS